MNKAYAIAVFFISLQSFADPKAVLCERRVGAPTSEKFVLTELPDKTYSLETTNFDGGQNYRSGLYCSFDGQNEMLFTCTYKDFGYSISVTSEEAAIRGLSTDKTVYSRKELSLRFDVLAVADKEPTFFGHFNLSANHCLLVK